MYKVHITRATVPIDTIMSAVGWANESTFACFYNKPIQDTAKHCGNELLNGC